MPEIGSMGALQRLCRAGRLEKWKTKKDREIEKSEETK